MKKRPLKSLWSDELNLSVPLREPPSGLEEKIMKAVTSRVPPHRVRIPPWGILAAAALLILAAGNVVQWVASRPAEVAMKPGLLVVMLSGTPLAPKAFGTIVLDPDDNHGVLAVRDLPLPTGAGQYQLWLKKGTEFRSAGVFSVNTDGYGSLMLSIPRGFSGFKDFCLTREPQGGSAVPTRPWLMTGAL